MEEQAKPTQKAFFCEHCGEYLPPDAKTCPKCGYPVGGGPAPMAKQSPRFLASARTASFMFLVSGLDGFASAILLLLEIDSLVAMAMSMGYPFTEEQIRGVYLGLIGFIFVASSLTLVASYLAHKRKHFKIVAICGFFSLFTLGVFYLEASIIGVLGLIATFRARQDFS